jgi:hypothetical protein
MNTQIGIQSGQLVLCDVLEKDAIMLDTIYQTVPGLQTALLTHPYLTGTERLASDLQRVLLALAPSGGTWLPGAIAGEIHTIAAGLGLGDHFIPRLGSTGNAALWLGEPGEKADIILSAHMDRPSFRVRDAASGELYPMCAIRIPGEAYRAGAKALRFVDGRLQVSAQGDLLLEDRDGQIVIHFETAKGELGWQDSVVMDAVPLLQDGIISGTGLDNCQGVMVALGAAYALRSLSGRRVLVVFSDLEEGIPDAYFAHGAARLAGLLPAPTYGAISVDAHTAGAHDGPAIGGGACFGTVSGWSRGSIVPPNYIALGIDLAHALNAAQPGSVQLYPGYLSRSDDVPLGRWTQVLGMIGAPMLAPHTVSERVALGDMQRTIAWLALYTAAALALAPELARKYALED